MSKAILGRTARRMAASIVLVILLAAAAGAGRAARAEEDPYTYCQRMFIAGLVKAVAIAVTSPANFNYYFISSLISYEWCLKYLV